MIAASYIKVAHLIKKVSNLYILQTMFTWSMDS